MVVWRKRHLLSLWMKTWKRRDSFSPWTKEAHGWSVDLAPWMHDPWGSHGLKETLSGPSPFLCLTPLLKAKPKYWPNLKSILMGFDALLQVLLISLAHENNVTSPLDLCPSIGRPIWIFFIILLVIGPFNGLGLGLGLEGAIGLCGVT